MLPEPLLGLKKYIFSLRKISKFPAQSTPGFQVLFWQGRDPYLKGTDGLGFFVTTGDFGCGHEIKKRVVKKCIKGTAC